MDFEFSPEQEMLRASVRSFLADKAPIASVRAAYERDAFDPAVWAGLRDLGVLDLDMVDAAVVLEELGRAVCPAPYASSAIAARSLAPGLDGIGTVAIFEDGARYDWRDPSTHVRDGAVYGTKVHVADAAMADVFVVTTRDGVFFTPAAPVSIEDSPTVDGSRKQDRVVFDGAPATRVEAGERDVERMLDRWGVAYAVDAVGAAQRALEMAIEYAKEREQFGKPIGAFQAVQHLCADMLRSVELARAAAYYACWALDDADAPEAHRAATLARAFAADALPAVGATAIQVFGGIGFTWEHDIHLYYKRLLSQSVALGTVSDYLEELAKIAID
jgi:acyl-CoA dehydrogenase